MPRNDRPGFTLIELLVVVVIIGILAVISMYQSDQASRRANIASMQQDLRALTVQQEIYHNLHLDYAGIAELTSFTSTAGVTVELPWVEPAGYAAVATHIRLPTGRCAVFMGPAPAGVADPATQPGQIACDF